MGTAVPRTVQPLTLLESTSQWEELANKLASEGLQVVSAVKKSRIRVYTTPLYLREEGELI